MYVVSERDDDNTILVYVLFKHNMTPTRNVLMLLPVALAGKSSEARDPTCTCKEGRGFNFKPASGKECRSIITAKVPVSVSALHSP